MLRLIPSLKMAYPHIYTSLGNTGEPFSSANLEKEAKEKNEYAPVQGLRA